MGLKNEYKTRMDNLRYLYDMRTIIFNIPCPDWNSMYEVFRNERSDYNADIFDKYDNMSDAEKENLAKEYDAYIFNSKNYDKKLSFIRESIYYEESAYKKWLKSNHIPWKRAKIWDEELYGEVQDINYSDPNFKGWGNRRLYGFVEATIKARDEKKVNEFLDKLDTNYKENPDNYHYDLYELIDFVRVVNKNIRMDEPEQSFVYEMDMIENYLWEPYYDGAFDVCLKKLGEWFDEVWED